MDLFPQSPTLDHDAVAKIDSLALAYVGDAVQTLYVRSLLLGQNAGQSAGKLHRLTIGKVSAAAQAEQADRVLPLLSEEERDVYRLARNHKTGSSAKNATVGDYHKASGLEAVWGYLYLTGQADRLNELLAIAIQDKEQL